MQNLIEYCFVFAGMNLNIRISGQHIEFEPNTYYASFSGELEAAASILWAMVSHLKDNSNNAKLFDLISTGGDIKNNERGQKFKLLSFD